MFSFIFPYYFNFFLYTLEFLVDQKLCPYGFSENIIICIISKNVWRKMNTHATHKVASEWVYVMYLYATAALPMAYHILKVFTKIRTHTHTKRTHCYWNGIIYSFVHLFWYFILLNDDDCKQSCISKTGK